MSLVLKGCVLLVVCWVSLFEVLVAVRFCLFCWVLRFGSAWVARLPVDDMCYWYVRLLLLLCLFSAMADSFVVACGCFYMF